MFTDRQRRKGEKASTKGLDAVSLALKVVMTRVHQGVAETCGADGSQSDGPPPDCVAGYQPGKVLPNVCVLSVICSKANTAAIACDHSLCCTCFPNCRS